ncbi:hypothetical protein GDO81_018233 [Engystomops pustulosus]|uniref:Uncharacterized protein n=1 Tax=Engystomops pustulosus TaxID=76066 RepID=A0AAV7ABZ8_ENGPU|nr:hypothetical protein GDO81_018233 [Engystomops pustulosus]
MEVQLFYPAIALIYFAALSWESRGNRLELGTAASLNVFCLFVVAQPICLLLGGYQGVFIYAAIAMTSYASLPRGEKEPRPDKAKKDKDPLKKSKRREKKKE